MQNSLSISCYGSHDAGWLSFYDFFRNECGLTKETNLLAGLIEYAQNGGWFIPFKEICLASDKPCILNRNENGRLHSLDGPALSYRDGWSIYAVNGVRVPEYIILRPEEITIEKIESENNTEIKRVMLDKFGLQNYLENSNAILVDEYKGTDLIGLKNAKLYRKEIQDDEPIVMVSVINSTAEPDGTFKNYWLRVPPNITSAKEAVAWTNYKTEDTYNPIIET